MLKNTVCTQPISLEQIHSICSSVSDTLDSLLDRNSLALIVGNTGGVTFTKQGLKVISESFHHHPIEKLIVNACDQYCAKTGDDCKIFLLILKESMHGITSMLKKYDEMHVRKTISNEIGTLVSFLPGIFENIRSTFAIVSSRISRMESFSTDLEGIIETFLESKFPMHVSKHLCKLLYEFLLRSIRDYNQAADVLQYLLLHFDLFCSKAYLPLIESVIIKGILLHHHLINENSKDTQFVLVWDISQKISNASWSTKMDCLPQQLNSFWLAFEKSLDVLKARDISVILTQSSVCRNMKCMCSKKSIILIDRLTEEDVNNIVFLTGVSPLSNLNDTLDTKNIAQLQNISSVRFGNFNYTQLECKNSKTVNVPNQITGNVNGFVPNHIVLCTLTDDLWKEYYSNLQNSLKVVRQWLDPSINKFQGVQLKQLNDRERNGSVQELLMIYRESLKVSDRTFENICFKSSSTTLGLSFPLGLWEFIFKIALENIPCKNQLLIPNMYSIMGCALLKTVCRTWSISQLNFAGPTNFLKFYDTVKHRLNTPIEPILSKEEQIFQIIQLLKQLLKIDAVIGTK